MTALAFPLRSNPAPFRFQGDARLINGFPEAIGEENKSPISILSIPGQTTFSTPSDVASRGALSVPELGVLFSLHGSTLNSINSAGVATEIDGVVAGSRPVVMERGPERFMQATVEISIASPGVVTWINHRLPAGTPIQFATTGALPTGLEPATTYYVSATGLTANTFSVSATDGGARISTTGGQSGTHTALRGDATYQVVIVSDAATYCLEDGNLFFIDLPEPARSVTFLAGRWIFALPSGKFVWSELNDARTIDPLAYATAEARPDGLVGAFADGGELWLYGSATIEVYSPSDDSDAPFVPLGGSFIDKGCAARDSIVSFDNAPHWVGSDNIVYRGAGYTAQRVSTHSVERAIAAVTDKTAIRAYTYTAGGHSFYVLTCADFTWAYDAATQAWAERKSRNRPDWRAWPYAFAFGKHLVGDKASGAIRELRDDVYTEAGEMIRVELTLPDVPGEVEFDRLEVDLATGVGLTSPSANGYEPKLMLSWSDDGGHTWSSERVREIGREGDYSRIVAFTRLGTSKKKGRRFRIAITDPVIKSFALGDIEAVRIG